MNGTRVGYARCSTDEQDVDIQIEQLAALGVAPERIYIDRGFSGTRRTHRTGLDQALAAVWPGSILTVTKFDRFARAVADAHTILTDLSERGVLFGLGASVYDWKDPFGRLFLQTLAMVAEFEANIGHLRTREGMAKARRQGKLRGKQPKLPPLSSAHHPPPLRRRRGVPRRSRRGIQRRTLHHPPTRTRQHGAADVNTPASSWLVDDRSVVVCPEPPQATYPAHEQPIEPIDYSIASPDLLVEGTVLPVRGSDHLPLLVFVRLMGDG